MEKCKKKYRIKYSDSFWPNRPAGTRPKGLFSLYPFAHTATANRANTSHPYFAFKNKMIVLSCALLT